MNVSLQQNCTIDAPPSTRICTRCLQTLPLNRFNLRSSITRKRQAWCVPCRCDYQRERRIQRSKKREERQLYSAWAKIASAQQRRTSVENVIVRLVLAFGGPAGLASAWFSAFERASSVRQLRACESLCFLIERFAANPEVMDLRRLDDLEAEQQRLAKQIIREQFLTNPQDVAEIARQHGFTLTPARAQATPSRA